MKNYAQGFVIAAIGVAVGYGIAVWTAPTPQYDGVRLPQPLFEALAEAAYTPAPTARFECEADRFYRMRNMELCSALLAHEKAADEAMDALFFLRDHGMVGGEFANGS